MLIMIRQHSGVVTHYPGNGLDVNPGGDSPRHPGGDRKNTSLMRTPDFPAPIPSCPLA
ncbi:hypothetical protein LJC15_01005 [Desulfovibrio sp. OttesenSCG-928-G11]|nr:hypothetical protein [Desulfovibrio sp. OttesenSCG-928-G11]